ncbi:BBSome complex member BBS7-like isoform X1 [Haemaphysalis longicornis]
MDLELNRMDYIQVDGTCANAAKVLPPSSDPKGSQKVVIGSQSGVLHCFGVNRGQIETVFKTLPGKSVGCVQLGGAVGSAQDKIFVASGNEVTGYTRKGKQFLKFDTNITDTIRCMAPASPVWEIDSSNNEGSVTCLGSYDITGDGLLDLLVGRNDGQIEVYSFNDLDEPVLRFSYNCGESVTSVQGGVVGNARYDEVLVTTYSGWVFGLSAEHAEKRLDPNYLLISPESAQKILKLKEEVEELEQKVAREREYYQLATYSEKGAVSAVPFFAVEDSFVLHHQDASYTLAIQLQTPIDVVVLQSNVPVDLLDSHKNSAVVSYTSCDSQASGNYLLATFRCQANTSRLEVKIRTIEGQQGVLRAYVTPHLQPKCCRLREFQIRPLSLHRRTHTLSEEDRPLNALKLRGAFSLAEVHAWLVLSLPEVSQRPPATDSATLYFVSTFLGTVLSCSYRRGEAIFKSDNISTISILKDVLTKQATRKKISLDISCDINDDSIAHTLKLIHPKLEHHLILAKKVQLVEALKDLKVYEESVDCLAPEYQEILTRSDELEAEFKRQPCHLERLYGMITDLYIDVYKFKGTNVKSKVPALLQVLDHYEFKALTDFFMNNM